MFRRSYVLDDVRLFAATEPTTDREREKERARENCVCVRSAPFDRCTCMCFTVSYRDGRVQLCTGRAFDADADKRRQRSDGTARQQSV